LIFEWYRFSVLPNTSVGARLWRQCWIRSQESEYRIQNTEYRIQNSEFRIHDPEPQTSNSELGTPNLAQKSHPAAGWDFRALHVQKLQSLKGRADSIAYSINFWRARKLIKTAHEIIENRFCVLQLFFQGFKVIAHRFF
jgi:hypothetical protein